HSSGQARPSSANGGIEVPGFRNIRFAARLANSQLRSAPAAKSDSKVGVESNGLVEVGNRSIDFAFSLISDASAVEDGGFVGVQWDALVVIGDRSIDMAFCAVSNAAVEKGEGVLGIEPNRLIKIGKGSIIPFFAISRTPVEKGDC